MSDFLTLRACASETSSSAPLLAWNMDHYSILEHSPETGPHRAEASVRFAQGGISATAAAEVKPPRIGETTSGHKQPSGEECDEQSLAEMARADLDATLQLLADRAQYITGASGAAIALRGGKAHEMLCRASAGSSAPELGAVLSIDHGLSGECVRTRLPLQCDDAAEDLRVNRAVCKELGIASVAMMPIVSDEIVLGIFELFSGKVRAFGERDLSTLARLGQMVEMAVKQAYSSQNISAMLKCASETAGESQELGSVNPPGGGGAEEKKQVDTEKHLFWSAALRAQGSAQATEIPAPVPSADLTKLHACPACGFPVSRGRSLCVECEEKKWRGQNITGPKPAPAAGRAQDPENSGARMLIGTLVADAPAGAIPRDENVPQDRAYQNLAHDVKAIQSVKLSLASTPQTIELSGAKSVDAALEKEMAEGKISSDPLFSPLAADSSSAGESSAGASSAGESSLFLSANLPSQSWFSQNKFVLAALLIVGIVVAALKFLH